MSKFLIFQSLYIIAIAILFYKGTDLSLTPVIPYSDVDTVIKKTDMPTDLDSSKTIVNKTILDSLKKNPYVDLSISSIVPKLTLEEKDREIADLRRKLGQKPGKKPDEIKRDDDVGQPPPQD